MKSILNDSFRSEEISGFLFTLEIQKGNLYLIKRTCEQNQSIIQRIQNFLMPPPPPRFELGRRRDCRQKHQQQTSSRNLLFGHNPEVTPACRGTSSSSSSCSFAVFIPETGGGRESLGPPGASLFAVADAAASLVAAAGASGSFCRLRRVFGSEVSLLF